MADWYAQWSARHAAMFGMTRLEDAETFAAWRSTFIARGYTFQELTHTTNVIAARTEPLAWRDDHLAEINRIIRDMRQAVIRNESNEAATAKESKCELCADSGMVIVPHPQFVIDGEWTRNGNSQPTCAVVCSCFRGRRIGEQQAEMFNGKRSKMQLTLEAYEDRVPRYLWKNLYDQQRLAFIASTRAEATSKAQDKQLGRLDAKAIAGTIGALPTG